MKLFQPLNFLEYNSIIGTLKKYINKYSNLKPFKEVIFAPALNSIMSKEKGSSNIYQKLIASEKILQVLKDGVKKQTFLKKPGYQVFNF